MTGIKQIRPVSRPFVYIKRIHAIWKQSLVHCFEVFRLIISAMYRFHQRVPIRNRRANVIVIRSPSDGSNYCYNKYLKYHCQRASKENEKDYQCHADTQAAKVVDQPEYGQSLSILIYASDPEH